jgi:hypothetical protein
LASAASIFFMSAGQWKANADALASMSAANTVANRVFIAAPLKGEICSVDEESDGPIPAVRIAFSGEDRNSPADIGWLGPA